MPSSLPSAIPILEDNEISSSPSPVVNDPADTPHSSRSPPRGPLPDWSGALDNSLGALTLNVPVPDQHLQPGTPDDYFPFFRSRLTNPCHGTGRQSIRTNGRAFSHTW